MFRRWSIGPNWKLERKAKGLRKGTEKKISQPRMKHGWNTDKKVGQLPQLARFARALHIAIKKGRGAHTFSPREKVPRRGG